MTRPDPDDGPKPEIPEHESSSGGGRRDASDGCDGGWSFSLFGGNYYGPKTTRLDGPQIRDMEDSFAPGSEDDCMSKVSPIGDRRAGSFSPVPQMSLKMSSGPNSLFGLLSEKATKVVRGEELVTLRFFEACGVYLDILDAIGLASAKNDCSERLGLVRMTFDEDPMVRKSLRELLLFTEDLNNVCWLLWDMAFFLNYFLKVFLDHESPGPKAYEETLLKHHSRAQKIKFSFYQLSLPGKQKMCNYERLILMAAEKKSSTELLENEVPRAASAMLAVTMLFDAAVEELLPP